MRTYVHTMKYHAEVMSSPCQGECPNIDHAFLRRCGTNGSPDARGSRRSQQPGERGAWRPCGPAYLDVTVIEPLPIRMITLCTVFTISI
jgi:hypothetical protein